MIEGKERISQSVVVGIRQQYAGFGYQLLGPYHPGECYKARKDGKTVEVCITGQPDSQILVKKAGIFAQKPVRTVVLDQPGLLEGRGVLLSIDKQAAENLFYRFKDKALRDLLERLAIAEVADLYNSAHIIAGEKPKRFSLRERIAGSLIRNFLLIIPDFKKEKF